MKRTSARRIALAAQGLGAKRTRRVTLKHLRTAFNKMGILQLDSVQYLCRSHYLPMFARVGRYSGEQLDRFTYESDELVETWAHECSLLPMEDEPLWRWHKTQAKEGGTWKNLYRFSQEEPTYVRDVRDEIRDRGGLRHNELSDPKPNPERGFWAGSSHGKMAMEWMFRTGELSARRDQNFQRVFDLSERVIPNEIREASTPSASEAKRKLLLMAARAHGISTADCLADYYRIKIGQARPLIAELVEEELLDEVCVEGNKEPWYCLPGTKAPRVPSDEVGTVLSPFDPVVWNRKRNVKLFDFDYKIEIYVPEAKRKFGYYVLPFLLGDEIVGRVEVKSDRKQGRLLIVGAWIEPGQEATRCAYAMASNLRELAEHLQFPDITGPRKGNLAKALRTEL